MPSERTTSGPGDAWPALALAEWSPTRDTLQLWTQIVGKIRLAHSPLLNHWWNVPLYVTRTRPDDVADVDRRRAPASRSTSTSSTHELDRRRVGRRPSHRAARRPVRSPSSTPTWSGRSTGSASTRTSGRSRWRSRTRSRSTSTGPLVVRPRPCRRFWRFLTTTSQVFDGVPHHVRRQVEPGAPVLGRARPRDHPLLGSCGARRTPVARRTAGPHVMLEAYSQEVSSAGYWPGGDDEGVFYSYAYPEPAGYRDAPVTPGRRYDTELGEFVLPYTLVRTAADPRALLLGFLRSRTQPRRTPAVGTARRSSAPRPRGPTTASHVAVLGCTVHATEPAGTWASATRRQVPPITRVRSPKLTRMSHRPADARITDTREAAPARKGQGRRKRPRRSRSLFVFRGPTDASRRGLVAWVRTNRRESIASRSSPGVRG